MATATNVGNDLTLRFCAAPTDTSVCSIPINWSSLKQNIETLVVLLYIEDSGESIFLFIPLHSAGDVCDIPLHIDLVSKTFKVYVYGMQKTNSKYLYKTYASAMRKLTATGKKAESAASQWKVNLGIHSIEQWSVTSIKNKANKNPFSITVEHQIPSDSVMIKPCNKDNAVPQVLQDVLVVIKQPANKPQTEMFMRGTASTSSIQLPVDMLASGQVAVTMYVLVKIHGDNSVMIYKTSASSEEKLIKWPNQKPTLSPPTPLKLPDMTKVDLITLMQKSKTFVAQDKNMYILTHLYRNKPPSYFKHILEKRCGVMEKYLKDFNGDPASCINGTINGLFFSAHIDRQTQRPPTFSYFGAQRLHIPAMFILHRNTNMFFADFYCHNICHYVTVVVTEAGSATDYFCKRKLIQLNPFDNAFIVKKYNHFLQQHIVHVTLSALVEVFYTEDIDIVSMKAHFPSEVFFTSVQTKGKGESQLYGIPKNKNCKICALK